MNKSSKWALSLNPQTKFILLILANIIAFVQNALYVELAWVAFLLLLISICGCGKAALKLIFVFVCCVALQLYILPNGPAILANTFMLLVSYIRKIFPCIIVGTLIVKKTSIREMMAVLEKWHFPKGLIIALSVTLRYFPAIKEELHYIKDAMKMRNLHGVNKMEAYLVPMIVSATNTAEELSAAAVSRGIENPKPKTSIVYMKWTFFDALVLVITVLFLICSLMYQ